MLRTNIVAVIALLITSVALSRSVRGADETGPSREPSRLDTPGAVWAALNEVLPPDVLEAIGPGLVVGKAGEVIDGAEEPGEIIKPPARVIVRGANLRHVPLKRLPAVNVRTLLAQDAQQAMFDKSLRFGVGRNLLADMRDGAWVRLADGWLWVLDVQSDGALALRVHALNMFLPPGATLIAYTLDAQGTPQQVVGPYEQAGPFDDGDIWLPTILASRVRMECWVPMAPVDVMGNDQPPAEDFFAVDRLQHVYRDPIEATQRIGNNNGGGTMPGPEDVPCHNQVACYPEWLDTANAVGGIGYIGTDSIYCTGQLLRTLIDDRTPYFLTANHCVGTNAEARSSEVFWRYQATTCGGAPPPASLATLARSSVCTLLESDPSSDFALLMIEGPLPANARFADWDNVDAANGTEVACIHHPQGKQKRISFGIKQTPATCGGALTHLRVDWTDGITLPGSSGSGVFRADNGKLIGQLHCGSSSCGNVTNDSFGSFSTSYGFISDLLAEGSDDGFENNETCSDATLIGAGVYTNRIVKSLDTDWYRIVVPAGQVVTATANFKHAWGDIDMRLYLTCGGPAVHVSQSTSNSEQVSYLNDTGHNVSVRLRVFIVGDVRNKYKLTVEVGNP